MQTSTGLSLPWPWIPTLGHQAPSFASGPTNFLSSRLHQSPPLTCKPKPISASPPTSPLPPSEEEEDGDEEVEYQVLTRVRSMYNDIVIVDTPSLRMLLLDSTGNVHSVRYKGRKRTGGYWDEFASLPAIIPEGPVAMLGLGGGTAVHLMLDLWPSLQLEGWEIDEILIDKARKYFGLSALEKGNQAGGRLRVHIGDALSPSKNSSQRYAGIIVDLFSEGDVLDQLLKVETWLRLKDRLMANGRLMVNCGGVTPGAESVDETASKVDTWLKNSVIKTLCEAFPGQLSWKRMPKAQGANYLAFTGPQPDLSTWSAVLPPYLSDSVYQWRPLSLQMSRPPFWHPFTFWRDMENSVFGRTSIKMKRTCTPPWIGMCLPSDVDELSERDFISCSFKQQLPLLQHS